MPQKTGHGIITGGATGLIGARNMNARFDVLGKKPLMTTLVVDSDERSEPLAKEFGAEYCDITVPFSDIETDLAEPERLTPVAREILTKHKNEFNSMSLGAGAGTRRYITQYFLEKHRSHVVAKIAAAIIHLRKKGATRIQIHIVGSDSGGTGSAIVILLPYLLAIPSVRAELLTGCEGIQLVPPILHLADVTCHVRKSGYPQKSKILANKFYTQCFVGNLLREFALNNEPYISYVTMTGNGNKDKFLGSISDVEAELGGVLAMQLAFYEVIKSREVDAMYQGDNFHLGSPGVTNN